MDHFRSSVTSSPRSLASSPSDARYRFTPDMANKARGHMQDDSHPAVYVRWIDSIRHDRGWDEIDAYAEDVTLDGMMHETIGWKIIDADHSVTIAHSRSEWEEGRCVVGAIQIPKVAIVEEHPLPHTWKGKGVTTEKSEAVAA